MCNTLKISGAVTLLRLAKLHGTRRTRVRFAIDGPLARAALAHTAQVKYRSSHSCRCSLLQRSMMNCRQLNAQKSSRNSLIRLEAYPFD
jgi:hypothetical protein